MPLASLILTHMLVANTLGAAEPVTVGGGKAILERNCGRCHAIDATSSSPLAQAPPLRDVYLKFPNEELRIRLSEGIVSHYKDMPMIDFTDEQITAILDYLSSLSQAR